MQAAAVGVRVRRMPLVWRTAKFHETLREAFGVDEQTARDLYALYLTGGLSAGAAKHFEKLMKPAMLALFAELKVARLKGPIYVEADEFLPVALPVKSGAFTLIEPPLQAILDAVGLGVDTRAWGRTEGRALRRLAPFLEYYFKKNNSQVNEWLKRHLNWLGASI